MHQLMHDILCSISSILIYLAALSVSGPQSVDGMKMKFGLTAGKGLQKLSMKNMSHSHFVNHKSGRSGTQTGFSPNISVHRARRIPKAGFLSSTNVNTCISIATMR
jgi:hypothetical protein